MKLLFPIISFLTVFSFHSAIGQDKFMPGYYVTASGDTVHGFIRVFVNYETEIIFRSSLKSEERALSIAEVTSFGFDGWYQYQRVTLDSGEAGERTVFAKVIVDGTIDLWRPQKGYVLHDDTRGTYVLAGSRSSNPEEAKKNYQANVGSFNILFQDCKDVKEAAAKAKIDERSLRALLSDYHACKGTTAKSFSASKRVRSFGIYAGISTSSISMKGEQSYLSEPEYAPSTNVAFGVIILKQPYQYSPLAFQTELGYSSAAYSASHYEIYGGAGNEFERYSDINIKFSTLSAKFGARLTARSNYFNPYVAAGLQLGVTIDHNSLTTGTFRINGQTDPVSEPVPLPTGSGLWMAVGGKRSFSSRMSLAADFCLSYEPKLLVLTPRLIVLF